MTRVPFICLVVLISSCAPQRSEILLNTKETPSTVLLQSVGEQESKIAALTGRGVLTFDSPELSGSASFEAVMKKPDSLLVMLEGPFGIDLGTFFLSRDTYVMYNSMENTVTTGTPSGASVRSVIPFELTHEQILNAFAGVFSLPSTEENMEGYTIDEDQFFLTFACGSNKCRYWVDPGYLLVTRYEMIDRNDEVVLEAKASAFIEQQGAVAARRLSLKFPKQNRQLSVAYSSLEINPSETNFRFTVPPGARKISRP